MGNTGKIKIYRVLLAEDDAAATDFVVATLSRFNFSVRTASDGRTALRYLAEESFELMLCDVMMPYVDGFKLLETARAHNTPLPPVVMLTALHDHESVLKAKKLGAVGYLVKPATVQQLLTKVKTMLNLSDGLLIDKTTMPFAVGTGMANHELLISLIGCPVKNPQAEFMKAVAGAVATHGRFYAAEIDASTEFAYASAAFEYLGAMAEYLQKNLEIPRNSVRFTGDFFGAAESHAIMKFKQHHIILDKNK